MIPTSQIDPSTKLDETQPTCQKSINNPTGLEFSPKKMKKIRQTKSLLKCFSQQRSLNSNKYFQTF